MISYEKVRESLRSTTFGLAIYHTVILGLIVVMFILGVVMAASALKNGNQVLPPEVAAEMTNAGQTALAGIGVLAIIIMVMSVLTVVSHIVLAIMHFKNAKKLQQGLVPKPWPYYLGLIIIALNTLADLGTAITAGTGVNVFIIIPILVLSGYGYAIYQYSIYKQKDKDQVMDSSLTEE